ncbi:hypothetical protein LIER_37340 [Lithospermum erythrorhizon]|uniref:Reverse transcriptase zinc-binding domain-containing protein n=1 Tax=Lithospermum erythrorhizon TaxID=34254 RepID=A0AAV3PNA2_LITER
MLQLTNERDDECVWLESSGFTQRFMWNGKMSTKDRLVQWGANVGTGCMFCSQAESQEHLFFLCLYTGHIRRLILQRLHCYKANQGVSIEQQWCTDNLKGKCLRKRIILLCFTTTVYRVV